MHCDIILSPEAIDDLRGLKANVRAVVQDAIETYLRRAPIKTSKSRIKRLRGLSRPRFRLRVREVRFIMKISLSRGMANLQVY